MLDFGSIFRYREDFYVYLVQADDLIYAAKILGKEITAQLVRHRDGRSRNPRSRTQDQPMYCFVVLSTERFKEQAAHYGDPAMDTEIRIEPITALDPEDCEALREEILKDDAANIGLRKILGEITLKQ